MRKRLILGLLVCVGLGFVSVELEAFGKSGVGVGVGQRVEVAEGFRLLPGFRAELLYRVARGTEGSWVSLTKDGRGNLIASDQSDKGLFVIRPAEMGDVDGVTHVRKMDLGLSGAQGMCVIDGAIYVNISGGKNSGVWRITDGEDGGEYNRGEHLIKMAAGGEHGLHAIIPAGDGKHFYFVGGNHTRLPKFESSRQPRNWSEDILLPRQWDARGHARGVLAPGGWIAKADLDGKGIEIISTGYRNQYDIAMNDAGELFTYDADMEWDMGMPWYRPTRVSHVTSGSEMGWRSGTGKWPAYYEDSVGAVLNLGPGSPTGIVFGRGAKFPAKYQRALYCLDWTFGTIYAVHLKEDGATYVGVKEEFLSAKPLAVTDAVVGDDGAFYFIVGGRGTASALYRVYYVGEESTVAVEASGEVNESRELRSWLEKFHYAGYEKEIDFTWGHLDDGDRSVRYAARIMIENQVVGEWRERALGEEVSGRQIVSLLALSRQGEAGDFGSIISSLNKIDFGKLKKWERLALLRAYGLAFIRQGKGDVSRNGSVIVALEKILGVGYGVDVDGELIELLVYLGSDKVVGKVMKLMAELPVQSLPDWAELLKRNKQYGGPIVKMLNNMPPTEKMRYAFALRHAKRGWTMPLRKEYFSFFNELKKHPGGASYGGFLTNMRDEAVANCTQRERDQLAELLGVSLVVGLPVDVKQPIGPGREWTHGEAVEVVGEKLTGRSFSAGKNLFNALMCVSCHRFGGGGGAIGPDLSTVGNRFSYSDLLEAIVEPSKVISDQYGSEFVITKDDERHEGRVVRFDDHVKVYTKDASEPAVVVKLKDIESIEVSGLSQMPSGLINSLSGEELRDLIAYLVSQGNAKAGVYKK